MQTCLRWQLLITQQKNTSKLYKRNKITGDGGRSRDFLQEAFKKFRANGLGGLPSVEVVKLPFDSFTLILLPSIDTLTYYYPIHTLRDKALKMQFFKYSICREKVNKYCGLRLSGFDLGGWILFLRM